MDEQDQGAVWTQCSVSESTWTWRDKLRAKLFPVKHCFAPEAPGFYKDCITIHTTTVLSWTDRLRVLLTGVICTHTRTVTENEVGDSMTNAVLYVGTSRDVSPESKP